MGSREAFVQALGTSLNSTAPLHASSCSSQCLHSPRHSPAAHLLPIFRAGTPALILARAAGVRAVMTPGKHKYDTCALVRVYRYGNSSLMIPWWRLEEVLWCMLILAAQRAQGVINGYRGQE